MNIVHYLEALGPIMIFTALVSSLILHTGSVISNNVTCKPTGEKPSKLLVFMVVLDSVALIYSYQLWGCHGTGL